MIYTVKNRVMLMVNIIFILTIFILNYFYQSADFDFTLKCITSAVFVILGVINIIYKYSVPGDYRIFCFGMLIGLVFAFFGDVIIKFNFIIGTAVFALGHICFVIAYALLHKFRRADFVISGVLFILTFIFLVFYPPLKFTSSVIRFVCIIYAFVISVMLGKAIGNYVFDKNKVTLTLFLASSLFFFSDLMLVLDKFAGIWKWTSNACMATYYPGVALLAFSIFLSTTIQSRSQTSIK